MKSITRIFFASMASLALLGCELSPLARTNHLTSEWAKNTYASTTSLINDQYIRVVNGESRFVDGNPYAGPSVGSSSDALCTAIMHGFTNNVRALLDRGADPKIWCEHFGGVYSTLDYSFIWGNPEMQQIFLAKGIAHVNPKIGSPTLRNQEIARVRGEDQKMINEMRADVARYREKMEREEARERAERSTRNGILGKVVVGVGIAAVTSQAKISDEAKVQIMSATAEDLASNGEGKATATLLNSPILNRQPGTGPGTPQVKAGVNPSPGSSPSSSGTRRDVTASPNSQSLKGSEIAMSGADVPSRVDQESRIAKRRNEDPFLEKSQTVNWCERHLTQTRKDFSGSRNRLISVGECTCVKNDAADLTQQYTCGFDYSFLEFGPSFSR